MLANIGSTELIIIAVIVFLFFGSSKLKELARGLGESTREMKNVQKEIMNDEKKHNDRQSNEDE